MAMTGITLVSANMATVVLEGFLYGSFLVLFFMAMYLRITRYALSAKIRPAGRAILNPIFLAAIALCIALTAHWVITVVRFYFAFLYFDNGRAPLLFWANLSQPTEIAKTVTGQLSMIIGDAMIIHRVYLIWNRNKLVVIFPILCWSGFIACTVGVTYQLSQYTLGDDVFLSSSGRWITSDWILTLITNLYSTSFIAGKLVRHMMFQEKMESHGGSHLRSILAIMIESAAMHTTWAIFFATTYQLQSNLQFTVLDLTSPVVGIANMLIYVRVGLGWSTQEEGTNPAKSSGTMMLATPIRFNVNRTAEGEQYAYGLRTLGSTAEGEQGKSSV
ncbi:hypothetical protein DFH08DRAFT_881270 [Mycena albidolilacea]|uniref:Uncharacterized protein n=1 Tax=Mycena albidolilacea TaxID=1033008 RepID=A0AAD7ELK7_9AGAR|nr:hypothetical protein DFH08DRAFT_881270 [Mycena albidolilacea]